MKYKRVEYIYLFYYNVSYMKSNQKRYKYEVLDELI